MTPTTPTDPWRCESCGQTNDARATLCVVCQKSRAHSNVKRRVREAAAAPDAPQPNLDFAADESPLYIHGFRYYVPGEDPAWSPLVLLGFEVDAALDGTAGAGMLPVPWWGGTSLSPLAWEATDPGYPIIRALHQCGGLACLHRAVVGIPLRPTEPARSAIVDALAALEGGEPTLESLLASARELGPRTGLDLNRTHRRCAEAFLVIDLPDDTREAAADLAALFTPALPADLAALFAPCAAARDALAGKTPDFADLCLFALGPNTD